MPLLSALALGSCTKNVKVFGSVCEKSALLLARKPTVTYVGARTGDANTLAPVWSCVRHCKLEQIFKWLRLHQKLWCVLSFGMQRIDFHMSHNVQHHNHLVNVDMLTSVDIARQHCSFVSHNSAHACHAGQRSALEGIATQPL